MSVNSEEQKKLAAQAAIHFLLPRLGSRTVIGIGTGSTVNHFITLLAEHRSAFDGTVASSVASKQLLEQLTIPVYELNDIGTVPYYIDGADEIDSQLRMIKGGGGALVREKIIATAAEQMICIAEKCKFVEQLGNFPVPVEVIPMARSFVARALVDLGGKPLWRTGSGTDNGNTILDVQKLDLSDPLSMEAAIDAIPGVVGNGIFAQRRADQLFLAEPSGQLLGYSLICQGAATACCLKYPGTAGE